MSNRQYYIYILTTAKNSALYTGVTNDLARRIYEHRNDLTNGFTKRYKVHKLVHYEASPDVLAAIAREKQIKSWNRDKKARMINMDNPGWHDLYETIIEVD
ncbi:MAG: excinuclease ABC subunit C [Chloroflexi bacterium RBG_13_57_8]|nr:MAG: excinuclease ABC subunit C [Chloroflexi bacterium RBG_13_57_8]